MELYAGAAYITYDLPCKTAERILRLCNAYGWGSTAYMYTCRKAVLSASQATNNLTEAATAFDRNSGSFFASIQLVTGWFTPREAMDTQTFAGSVPYQYQPFDRPEAQIRLAELQPGAIEDDVRLKIHTTYLPPRRMQRPAPTWTTAELQKTLDSDWTVRENLHGRFIFERHQKLGPLEACETSYNHPATGIQPRANNYNYPPLCPPYEALSHVWGSSAEEPIFIEPSVLPADSVQPGSYHIVKVRRELALALRQLRLPDSPRWLWVDNICIDQRNSRERSSQVQRMGAIYKSAHRVIVWLGSTDDTSHLAMSTLMHIGEQVEITDRGTWRVNAPECAEPTWSRTSVPIPYDTSTWRAVASLLRRPWFERVWVWQEVKLSSDRSIVQCGSDHMTLYTLCRAAWCLNAKGEALPTGMRHLALRAAVQTLPRYDEPFIHLLLHLRHKKCADPRDKIYGVLGLAPQPIADMIDVNYDRPIPDVYQDCCLALLQTTQRTDFLIACDLAKRSFLTPSWVPDFHDPAEWPMGPRPWMLSTTQASGISEAVAEQSRESGGILSVHGVLCSEVYAVGPRGPDRAGTDEELNEVFRAWFKMCPKAEFNANGEHTFDAFVKTIYWNILRARNPKDHGLEHLDHARALVRRVLALQFASGHETSTAPSSASETGRMSVPDARDAVFLTTADGRMGMTSSSPRVSDVVCVILGCPLPMILRPQTDGTFSVVGVTYLHGIMDAESLLGPLGDEWALQAKDQPWSNCGFAFFNKVSNELVDDDPRLGPLPLEWVRLDAVRETTDPRHFVRFRHMATGVITNGDPRLRPEALIARGVHIQRFDLC